MPNTKSWALAAPRLIYENYPHSDLLPIDPPGDDETIGQFVKRLNDCGDTLFRFICTEALEGSDDLQEFDGVLRTAISDLESVLAATARLIDSEGTYGDTGQKLQGPSETADGRDQTAGGLPG